MKKYQCNACEINICTAEYQGGQNVPFKCTGIFDVYHKPHWKEIEEKAATLPKLTVEVFDRPDCPEWAKIAVVNSNGKAYYGPYKEAIINSTGGWYGLYEEQGKWKRIGNELFDASDWQNSLIKRPAKLPEWCKVGEWAYSTVHKEYVKITGIDEFEVEFDSGAYYAVLHKVFREDYKPARLRPYNAEEMRGLVGEALKTADGDMQLITSFYKSTVRVVVGGLVDRPASEILEIYTHLDGSPCGVLEHLGNGEWVE